MARESLDALLTKFPANETLRTLRREAEGAKSASLPSPAPSASELRALLDAFERLSAEQRATLDRATLHQHRAIQRLRVRSRHHRRRPVPLPRTDDFRRQLRHHPSAPPHLPHPRHHPAWKTATPFCSSPYAGGNAMTRFGVRQPQLALSYVRAWREHTKAVAAATALHTRRFVPGLVAILASLDHSCRGAPLCARNRWPGCAARAVPPPELRAHSGAPLRHDRVRRGNFRLECGSRSCRFRMFGRGGNI